MKAAILHLSDSHLREEGNAVLTRVDRIAGALRSLGNLEDIYLVFSGDLANSGKSKEYDIALDFLVKLGDRIKSESGINRVEYIVVPGNHDCNFENDSQNRRLIVDSLRSNISIELKDDSVIKTLCGIQDEFFSFLEVISNRKYEGPSRLFYEYRFPLDNKNIIFRCYNTAWTNDRENRKGTIIFPSKYLCQRPNETDVVCSVFHHPYLWFDVENGRAFRRFVEQDSDIILTGHEHELDQISQKKISGIQNDFLNGGRLQGDNQSESKFQVQIIDTSDNTTQCVQFSWMGDKYTKTGDSERRPLMRLDVGTFINNDEFMEYLNDPGIIFVRPERRDLKLDDIFVYPDFRLLDASAAAPDVHYTIIRGDRLLDYLMETRKIAIFGSDRSGKTVLLKSLYKDMQNRGFVPLLIEAEKVLSQRYKTMKIIDECFVQQYSKTALEDYQQLQKAKRVILVDNANQLRDSKLKKLLIKELTEFASVAVIVADEFINVSDLLGTSGSSALVQFKHLVLPDFSYETTGRLIERWVSSRQQPEEDEATLAYRIKTLENTVNSFVRNKVLPPNPFVILSLLQILEAEVPSSPVSGSYGYLYEFLITGAFSSVSRGAEDLDIKYNFLAYLANYMFENNISEVGEENLSKIASDFSKYATVTIAQENLKQELVTSRVMKLRDGEYRFTHPYVYHYFIARYLSTIIRDPAANQEFEAIIGRIINNLQADESANIVVFLCYLAPGDASLIDRIIGKARELFHNQKEFSFPSDADFLDHLSYKEPVITVFDIDPETAREMSRQALDTRQSDSKPESVNTAQLDDSTKEIIAEVRLAYRIMYVLGQILRSFPGSRGYRKRPLAEECCKLGMRLLSAAIQDLSQRSTTVRQEFVDFFRRESPKSREEYAIAHANSFVFMLGQMASQNVIKSVAMSIGSSRLSPLYDEIMSEDQSVTFQLINICIRLNHFKTVPEREMVDTYNAIKNKHFTSTLLKMIAIDCLLKYPPNRTRQQSIFSKLGIKLERNPLLLRNISKARLLSQGN